MLQVTRYSVAYSTELAAAGGGLELLELLAAAGLSAAGDTVPGAVVLAGAAEAGGVPSGGGGFSISAVKSSRSPVNSPKIA